MDAPEKTASASLSDGSLSPVKEDSSTEKPSAFINRASAGTRSPAFSDRISPGTASGGIYFLNHTIAHNPATRTLKEHSALRAPSPHFYGLKTLKNLKKEELRKIPGILI